MNGLVPKLYFKNDVALFYLFFILILQRNIIESAEAEEEMMFRRYELAQNVGLASSFSKFSMASRLECCLACSQTDRCGSISYRASTRRCELSEKVEIEIPAHVVVKSGWMVYSKIPSEPWMLVFRAGAGLGSEPYVAFVYGENVTSDDERCRKTYITSCSQYYRHNVIDSWDAITISQVKFSLFADGEEKAFIIFNGEGSNVTNWFHSTRIVTSSWPNIAMQTFDSFKIKGGIRNFVINVDDGDCKTLATYSMTIWQEIADRCDPDVQDSYPQFLYSDSDTYAEGTEVKDLEKAEIMAIYIQ